MNNFLIHLPYLLFMNPKIGLSPSFSTQSCTVFYSTSAIRSCNRVINSALPTNEEVEQIKSFFGVVPFTWAAENNDESLMQILKAHNLSCQSSLPAMALNLGSLNKQVYDANIMVKAIDVHNLNDLTQCISIIAHAFNGIAACPSSTLELSKVINLFVRTITSGNMTFYLGYYQGNAVATGMALRHNEIATLHWIGTLPEYRNHGLGHAITHKALLDMQHAGCTHALLLASALGKPLYERMGFKEYALYNMYGN